MRFRQKVAAFKRAEQSPVVTVSVLGNMTAKTASNLRGSPNYRRSPVTPLSINN